MHPILFLVDRVTEPDRKSGLLRCKQRNQI